MKVMLLSCTPDALNLLLRTKNTRLSFDEDPATWSEAKKAEHLEYMLDTIRSSWEFVDYTFSIEGVTRAFTHQLVRTRSASYAQQSLRAVDARDFEVLEPAGLSSVQQSDWRTAVDTARIVYRRLVDEGVPIQDARGILPINVLTSIIMKANLRTLSDMAKVRLCTRTQGEYQDVFREMRRLVLAVTPWAEPFLQVQCVGSGTCAFPRYGRKECPVWFDGLDESERAKKTAAERFWNTRHEANPVARGGKAV